MDSCGSLCNSMHMATNLQIEDNLIQETLVLGGHRTKRAVVEEALREYVQRRKQLKILELFGTIEYDQEYDYKQQRQKP
jgi:Arc/MetJ family transcription regulator